MENADETVEGLKFGGQVGTARRRGRTIEVQIGDKAWRKISPHSAEVVANTIKGWRDTVTPGRPLFGADLGSPAAMGYRRHP